MKGTEEGEWKEEKSEQGEKERNTSDGEREVKKQKGNKEKEERCWGGGRKQGQKARKLLTWLHTPTWPVGKTYDEMRYFK